MNKPQRSILPRFGFSTVDGDTATVDNLQVAATIYAFDVPLHEANPYSVQSGDGIKGHRVVWHFKQTDRGGNSPKGIAEKWFNDSWIEANPDHPLSVCKRSFDWLANLKTMLKTGRGLDLYHGPACKVTNTRQAAVLAGLGHPIRGWQRNSQVTTWCFDEAAASDAALYDADDLYEKLPDAAISYARGAILGHLAMIDAAKKVLQARVSHKGRTAIVGRDCTKHQIDTIEKLLYRK